MRLLQQHFKWTEKDIFLINS